MLTETGERGRIALMKTLCNACWVVIGIIVIQFYGWGAYLLLVLGSFFDLLPHWTDAAKSRSQS